MKGDWLRVMNSAMNMTGNEAAVNVVAEETMNPSSPSPTLVQPSDDGTRVAEAGSFAHPIWPPRTPDSIQSREQVTPGLQKHLAEVENRVSKALHQVMESMEIKLSGAVKQAAIDTIDNLGKEAVECIILSQRKVDLLQYQLNYTKQHALSMLMQVKRVSDAQISDAENKILIERRRAQEAETKLQSIEEINKKLKAELERKGQQVEEVQKRIYPGTAQQGLQVSVTEGSESRRAGNRFKGLAGEKKTQQIPNGRNEAGALVMSPADTIFDRSANGVAEVQTENVSSCPLMDSWTYHDKYTATTVQMGVLASEFLRLGRRNFEVKEDLILTGNGHVMVNKLQESPTNESVSGAEADNISFNEHQRHSSSEDSNPAVTQVEVSASLMEKGQLTAYLKADLESRLAKDSDEEKSSLTTEALYGNHESLPPGVHPGDEYQSSNSHVQRLLESPDRPKHLSSGGKKYDHEADASIHCTEELEMDEDSERGSAPLSNISRLPKIVTAEDCTGSHEVSGAVIAEIQAEFGTQESSQGSKEVWQEIHEVRDHVDTVVVDNSVLMTAMPSLVTANRKTDAPLASSPVINSVSDHIGKNLPNKDSQRPEAQNESTGDQVSKRKRNQGDTVSKYDLFVTDRSSKKLEGEGAVSGAFDILAAAGVDTHISSRDSRRLMQGARQLFSLAERKWR